MHVDTEQVQRLLHGELAREQETTLRDHLASCAACRARVAAAEAEEAEMHALLGHLDHPAPPLDAATVVARARGRSGQWLRWAAGIVLALGAVGGAYAVPGSPLRGLVRGIADRMSGAPPPQAVAPPVPAPDAGVAGIAVAAGDHLTIVFTSPQVDGGASVSLTDGAEVVVRAVAGAATFTSEVDRLVVDNHGSTAVFEIDIPRRAPRVEILVGDRLVFVKEGSRVTAEDSVGPYELPLRAR